MMKIAAIFILSGFLIISCKNETTKPSISELIEVEKAFSDMSLEKGMVEAFLYFADDEAVILRGNRYPIVGKEALSASMSQTDDSGFSLTWKPIDARISVSGDLGYTYGVYKMSSRTEGVPESKGTYVTIWKKNEAGDWRFVMDTGQEGLGEE